MRITKKETRRAFEILTEAIYKEATQLKIKGLYENSLQESHFIRKLQDIGVWLNIVK